MYADSSALAKLVVRDPESAALAAWIPDGAVVISSALARVEVTRVVRLAGLEDDLDGEVETLLDGCVLLDVDDGYLRVAASIASDRLRTLDAIHLATALDVRPDALLVYDRTLAREAARLGLRVAAPGAE